MPIYEYHCHTCGKDFAIQAKIADAPPARGLDCVSSKCVLEKQLSLIASPIKSSPNQQQSGECGVSEKTPTSPPAHGCGGCCSH